MSGLSNHLKLIVNNLKETIKSTITIRFLLLIIISFIITLLITLLSYPHVIPNSLQHKLIIISFAFLSTALSGIILLLIIKRDNENNDEKNAVEYFWFLILLIGVWLILGKHFSEFVSEIKKTEDWTLLNYFKSLIEKESYALFSVLLASLLTDFILIFIKRLRTLHTTIETKSQEYTNKINESTSTINESIRILTNLDNHIKETQPILNVIGDKIKDSENEIKNINIKLEDISKQFINNFNQASNLSEFILQLVSVSNKEKEFIDTVKSKRDDIRWVSYQDSIGKVREKASFALSKYNHESDIISQLIASKFIQKFFDDFILEDEIDKVSKYNEMFANFGIMSGIVCSLFDNKDMLYSGYKKKIIYLTTLTMPPDKFLNSETVGSSEVIKKKWKNYLSKISIYDKTECYLKDIQNAPSKYDFIRICLFSDNHTTVNSISSKSIWLKTKIELPSTPDYIDVDRALFSNPFDFFIKRFHTTKNNCRYFELSLTNMKNLCNICDNYSECQSKQEDNLSNCINSFFNKIPLDIFAIGIENNDATQIEWKGCLSGYLGGDYNYMHLAWHDPFISPDEWYKIKDYLNIIYENSKNNYLSELK